jgi:hypothetical protein
LFEGIFWVFIRNSTILAKKGKFPTKKWVFGRFIFFGITGIYFFFVGIDCYCKTQFKRGEKIGNSPLFVVDFIFQPKLKFFENSLLFRKSFKIFEIPLFQ